MKRGDPLTSDRVHGAESGSKAHDIVTWMCVFEDCCSSDSVENHSNHQNHGQDTKHKLMVCVVEGGWLRLLISYRGASLICLSKHS